VKDQYEWIVDLLKLIDMKEQLIVIQTRIAQKTKEFFKLQSEFKNINQEKLMCDVSCDISGLIQSFIRSCDINYLIDDCIHMPLML
jgi:hypothetical protein